ncbi:unnamed protein product [Phytophthora lilii]|uniref:Unnamed protein product n=1 Tax=Phytophthora lilii TaxID=2077276 RepID=A0A9W6X2Z4_9STRA|nr:unnamed protein product [Phytophthora lilii]
MCVRTFLLATVVIAFASTGNSATQAALVLTPAHDEHGPGLKANLPPRNLRSKTNDDNASEEEQSEERGIFTPRVGTESMSFWKKVFYKLYPHVKPPVVHVKPNYHHHLPVKIPRTD